MQQDIGSNQYETNLIQPQEEDPYMKHMAQGMSMQNHAAQYYPTTAEPIVHAHVHDLEAHTEDNTSRVSNQTSVQARQTNQRQAELNGCLRCIYYFGFVVGLCLFLGGTIVVDKHFLWGSIMIVVGLITAGYSGEQLKLDYD